MFDCDVAARRLLASAHRKTPHVTRDAVRDLALRCVVSETNDVRQNGQWTGGGQRHLHCSNDRPSSGGNILR